jgi:hypothetical protein
LLTLFGAAAPLWRAGGVSGLISVAVVGWLWSATDGGRSNTEAWLVLSAAADSARRNGWWRRAAGQVGALGLGLGLTLALLAAWRWATATRPSMPPTR